MSSSLSKWIVKFTFKKDQQHLLIDLAGTPLFNKKYPVFKMLFAQELMEIKKSHYYKLRRAENSAEIKDPTGKDVPMNSCIFIYGISKELGIIKLLFFPQPEGRLALCGLDEVWITVLEKISESQRLTLLTNVVASLVTNQDGWSQVYLVY